MATLFTKIMNREIPGNIVYEDEKCVAFRDIQPEAPTHVLLVPREEIPSMNEVTPEHQDLMGHLMCKVPEIAKKLGLTNYRLAINTGAGAGQSVFHLHIHILGGRVMSWPPG